MKALVTTHAQMFQTPDGKVWTNSVYGYNFFKRYLDVFENVRLVTRMKEIEYEDLGNKVIVSGPGLEFYSLPFYHGPWQYAKNYFNIKNALSYAIDGCDCAVLRIPDQLSFQLFKKIKKEGMPCAIEVVAHSWDLYAPGTIKTVLRPFLRVFWDINQKKLCKNAEGVSYVTEKYIQKRYPANIKNKQSIRFETSYTSADLNENYYHKPRREYTPSKEQYKIIHVSGINNSAKGHYELLYSVSKLITAEKHNITITFVGGGTKLTEYKNIATKLGLDQKVRFLGQITDSDKINSLLIESDLFVFPTLTEGLPRVVIEAMATGLPCIASSVGGIPELLSERALVKPKDICSLAARIHEFITNTEVLIEESERNYNRALDFSSSNVTMKRRAFYMELKRIVQ